MCPQQWMKEDLNLKIWSICSAPTLMDMRQKQLMKIRIIEQNFTAVTHFRPSLLPSPHCLCHRARCELALSQPSDFSPSRPQWGHPPAHTWLQNPTPINLCGWVRASLPHQNKAPLGPHHLACCRLCGRCSESASWMHEQKLRRKEEDKPRFIIC